MTGVDIATLDGASKLLPEYPGQLPEFTLRDRYPARVGCRLYWTFLRRVTGAVTRRDGRILTQTGEKIGDEIVISCRQLC